MIPQMRFATISNTSTFFTYGIFTARLTAPQALIEIIRGIDVVFSHFPLVGGGRGLRKNELAFFYRKQWIFHWQKTHVKVRFIALSKIYEGLVNNDNLTFDIMLGLSMWFTNHIVQIWYIRSKLPRIFLEPEKSLLSRRPCQIHKYKVVQLYEVNRANETVFWNSMLWVAPESIYLAYPMWK